MPDDVAAQPTQPAATASPQQYDTVDAAVDAMFDRQAVQRDEAGKFAAKAAATAPATADVVDIKTAKPVDATKADIGHNGGPELEDDFFEFEPEKAGDSPRRVKVDEVLAAYEELPALRKELETVKTRSTAAAPEVIKTVQENMQHRAQLLEAYEDVLRIVRPTQPDPRRFVDDPEGYRAAMERYQGNVEYINDVKAEHAKHAKAMQDERSVIVRAAQAKAEQEIYAFWPEMAKPETRNAAFAEIKQFYGIEPNQLIDVPDANVWQVVKDAVAFKKSQAKQAEAVKVARAKPKLVRGNARQATTGAEVARQSAMSKFKSSELSVDDAVNALFGN